MKSQPQSIQNALEFALSQTTPIEQAMWLANGLNPRGLSDEGWAQLLAALEPNLDRILALKELWAPRNGRHDEFGDDTRANCALHNTGRDALALEGDQGREAARRFAQTFGSAERLATARESLKKTAWDGESAIGMLGFFADHFLSSLSRAEDPSVLEPWSHLAFERALRDHSPRKDPIAQRLFSSGLGRLLRSCDNLKIGPQACPAALAERVGQVAERYRTGDWATHRAKELAFAEQIALHAATRQAEKEKAEEPADSQPGLAEELSRGRAKRM